MGHVRAAVRRRLLALLLRRLEARGARVVPIFVRRLATLFAIGWLVESVIGFHILTTYAVCGLLVLAMRRWSTRAAADGGRHRDVPARLERGDGPPRAYHAQHLPCC